MGEGRSRQRQGQLLAAALVSAALVAGCGGRSGSPSASTVGGASASGATGGAVRSGLAFPRCMRSHGVPNFPDPTFVASGSNGNHTVRMFSPNSGVNPQSPAFQSAARSCQGLLPKGAPGPGPLSLQARAQMLKVSECMRAHGILRFPDPTTSPSASSGNGAITGSGGYYLVVPTSISTQSPAFKQAATACNFGPRGVR
jgi:hypothetical protein